MSRVWRPDQIITDFESSLIPAISTEVNPNVFLYITMSAFISVSRIRTQRMFFSSQPGDISTYSKFGFNYRLFSRWRNQKLLSEINGVSTPANWWSRNFILQFTRNSKYESEGRTSPTILVLRRLLDKYCTIEHVECVRLPTSNEQHLWRYFYPLSYKVILRSIYLGFHNRLNRRLERAHANIWSFIRCIASEESRFQHQYIQINTGAQQRPKSNVTDAIQKRIDTLNERYNKNEIDVEDFLNALSLLIAQKKWNICR